MLCIWHSWLQVNLHLHNHILPTWVFSTQLHFSIMCLLTICPWFWSRDASYFPTLCIVIVLSQKSFLLIPILLVHCWKHTLGVCWLKDGLSLEALPPQMKVIIHSYEICLRINAHTHLHILNYYGGTVHKWLFICMHALKSWVIYIFILNIILNLKLNMKITFSL